MLPSNKKMHFFFLVGVNIENKVKRLLSQEYAQLLSAKIARKQGEKQIFDKK